MIVWKVDIIDELRTKGITAHTCKKSKLFGQKTMSIMAHNEMVDISTINKLCKIFDCDISDLIEYVEDDEDEE